MSISQSFIDLALEQSSRDADCENYFEDLSFDSAPELSMSNMTLFHYQCVYSTCR